jgi:hypothetical protein
MQTLKDLILEVFRDTLYEATVVLRSDRSRNLTVLTDNLRGVCGITTTTIAEPAKPVSETVERTILKVKFFVLEPTLKEHSKRMTAEALKIDGVYSFMVVSAREFKSRIYREGFNDAESIDN